MAFKMGSPDRDRPRQPRPRVLHLFGSLALGGIETWLVHMLRHQHSFSVQHEILLTKADIGPYEAEVRGLRIPIHRLLMPKEIGWFRRFGKFLRKEGPFAAVHSHMPARFSAPALEVAKRSGVRVRIVHSHSAYSQGKRDSFRRRIAARVAVPWLQTAATRRIGISELALEEVSKRWREDRHASVLLYGFDFSRFPGAGERARQLRTSLGIADEAPIVGHIGRFEAVKNHALLIDAFALCARELPEGRLVLVGDGRLRDTVEAQVRATGLAEKILFPGTTDDVAAYMAMFDLFALPSFSEGLGIVVVEAQAAGTPALVSETIPREVSIVPGAVEVLGLAAGAEAWGEAMARLVQQPKGDAADWLDQVERSPFGIQRCIDELDEIYLSEIARNSRPPS